MRRTSRLVAVLALLLTLFGVGAVLGVQQAAARPAPVYQTVQVRVGDTLWDIARQVGDGRTDIRKLVWEIEVMNGLRSATIHPGQLLVVRARQSSHNR